MDDSPQDIDVESAASVMRNYWWSSIILSQCNTRSLKLLLLGAADPRGSGSAHRSA